MMASGLTVLRRMKSPARKFRMPSNSSADGGSLRSRSISKKISCSEGPVTSVATSADCRDRKSTPVQEVPDALQFLRRWRVFAQPVDFEENLLQRGPGHVSGHIGGLQPIGEMPVGADLAQRRICVTLLFANIAGNAGGERAAQQGIHDVQFDEIRTGRLGNRQADKKVRLGGAGPVDEMERARLRRASRQIWRRRSFGPTAERVFDHAAQIAFELAGNIKMRAHRVEVFPVKRLHVLNGDRKSTRELQS